jgi:hypothetical protein
VRLHRIDENASAEVAPLLDFLRGLQRRYQTAVVLVHHARKGASHLRAGQALRGSSELHAWGDTRICTYVAMPKTIFRSPSSTAPQHPALGYGYRSRPMATRSHFESRTPSLRQSPLSLRFPPAIASLPSWPALLRP